MAEKTVLYAYLIETQGAGVPGFGRTVVVPASQEDLKDKIRARTGCAGADVVIVPPEEWDAPQLSSLSQQELTSKFPMVMLRVLDHMEKVGLRRMDPGELVRNGSVMPNPVTGKVFFVYKIRQAA